LIDEIDIMIDIMEIYDDDSDDNINDGSEVCIIYEEYGKNEKLNFKHLKHI
jgi:hypothetical protein